MGNKQKRDAHLALQVEHQIDNLRPNGDIQGRHRLVGYHHLRIQRQRAGNADPLPLAAGKGMGIAPGMLRLQPHALQQPGDSLTRCFPTQQAMHPQRLHNRIADRLTRIKRGVRILKNKLNIAPQSLQLAAGEGIDPLTVEGNGASLGLYQPQQRPAGGRLAAAGLAHQRQGLSRPEIKTDLLHRMHFARHAIEQPAAHRKTGHQVTHLQDRLAGDYRIGRFALRQRLARQRKTARQILATHLPQPRDRRQQRLRIRVLRRTKDLLNAAGLYRLAAIHHQHPIGDIGHDAHIVGDKDHPHRHLLLQNGNELQNLRLDGDIQRRGWLIGYQHRRPTGERHGDHHPLTHAAGELVRIARKHLFRLGNTHLIEHLFRRAQRLFAPQPLVQAQGFGNLLADGKNRIQRGHRLLKNHGQIRAAHPAHLSVRLLIERDHLPVTPPQPQPLAVHLAAGRV